MSGAPAGVEPGAGAGPSWSFGGALGLGRDGAAGPSRAKSCCTAAATSAWPEPKMSGRVDARRCRLSMISESPADI